MALEINLPSLAEAINRHWDSLAISEEWTHILAGIWIIANSKCSSRRRSLILAYYLCQLFIVGRVREQAMASSFHRHRSIFINKHIFIVCQTMHGEDSEETQLLCMMSYGICTTAKTKASRHMQMIILDCLDCLDCYSLTALDGCRGLEWPLLLTSHWRLVMASSCTSSLNWRSSDANAFLLCLILTKQCQSQ